ncbi:MAG: ATP-binding cassette domain-containing protein [Candidatus Methanospirareceae archaeon]
MAWILKAEDLGVRIKDKQILEDINLSIDEKEKVAIIGMSGSGKTTLLYALRGIKGFRPSNGSIIYNIKVCMKCLRVEAPSFKGRCKVCGSDLERKEIDIYNNPNKIYNQLKHRAPMMLQRTPLIFSDRTTLENVETSLRYVKYPQRERRSRSIQILEKLMLSHRLHQAAGVLSGGEKQRLALAREVALDPLVLFLDEPTEMLDPITAKKVYDYIKTFEFTTVFSTHLLDFVEDVTDRAILLCDGHIEMDGRTRDVISFFKREGGEREEKILREDFGEPMIICKDIRKYYPVPIEFYSRKNPYVKVIDGVDLEVRRGEIRGLIGISGSGKTVLTDIIAGNIMEFKGICKVNVKGEMVDLHDIWKRDKVRKAIRRAFQEYELFPARTIYDNLRGAIPEYDEEDARERIYEMMAKFFPEKEHLSEILDRYPDEICEGERQRIMVVMALLSEPEIVLLDEPSGTLDIHTKVAMARGIRKIRDEKNTTFLIVTHDFDFAKEVCDNIDFMKEGKIVASYNGKDIKEDFIKNLVKNSFSCF